MARPVGSVNRATTQRKLIADQRTGGVPLAKEMMEQLAVFYFKAAQQLMPPLPIPENYDPDKLRRFNSMAEKCAFYARSLAPYQSPTYRSITVQAPRDTAHRGTPAIDALEAFVLTLAAVRRRPEPTTVDVKANEPEPDVPMLVEVKRNGST